MCGRYSLFTDDDNLEILRILQEVSERRPNAAVKTGEVFPTNTAPILKLEQGIIRPDAAVWGFPNFARKGVIINARSETAAEKKLFRESLFSRRCIVPSTGFFEWSQDKAHQKYRFYLPESDILYMAGLYSVYNQEERFVILTTEGNASIRDIHHRMPVVISPDHLRYWLGEPNAALQILSGSFPMLEREPA